ncbi:hypothetical protein O3P69_008761 [Scylla paramamosain]|uniref:Ionotropic glutamate receptor L-glutamate and glycine-binding domain-containing protein n=2 Tax=Scylla paramamosain TaxID=85552 RepID=A0AAW0SLI3_SCYPA
MIAFAIFRGRHLWSGLWMVVVLTAFCPSLSIRATDNFKMMLVSFLSTIAAQPMIPPLDPDKMELAEETLEHPSMMLQESSLWEADEDAMKIQGGKIVSMKKAELLEDSDVKGLWHLTQDEEEFLGHQLEGLVKNEMPQCALLLAHDLTYRHSRLLRRLLFLPNPKQVVEISETKSLEGVAWRGKRCRGYILLLTNHTSLHSFMSQPDDLWDFDGRFVMVGVSREELQELASSKKGVKTEHLIGVVKVVTFEFEPSVLYYRDSSGKVEFPFGIDIEVVNALARTLNFTIIFEEPPKGELWGVEGEDGEWTGMVGRLARGEADIGVANLFLTLTRLGAVDYSAPYDAEVSCFLVRSDPAVPRWMSLVLPFQFTTWGAILLGVLVTGVFLYIFAMAGDQCGGEVPILQSLSFACFYASGMHFREPQQLMPLGHNTRGINTIRSLHAAHMEVSGLGSFFKGALASAVDPYLQGLAKRFVPYQELELVWNQVKKGHAAYLHNRQFLEFVIATQFTSSKGESSMRIMKECFAPYSIAMALQQNSPLKKKFDHVISWMLASGLVRHWFLESLRLSRKVKTKVSNKVGSQYNTTTSLQLSGIQGVIPLSTDHMQGVFFIYMIGQLMAFLVLVLECCQCHFSNKI